MDRRILTLLVSALAAGSSAAITAATANAAPGPIARAAGEAHRQALPAALEATVAESHEALRKILNGDPSGYAALFADRADITLGNPFGPFGKGRAEVLARLSNAAGQYREGTVLKVDRVAVYGGGNRYVLVEIEQDRAKLGDRSDFSAFTLRQPLQR